MHSSAGHRLECPPLELVGLDADLHVVLLLHLLHEPGEQFNRHFGAKLGHILNPNSVPGTTSLDKSKHSKHDLGKVLGRPKISIELRP